MCTSTLCLWNKVERLLKRLKIENEKRHERSLLNLYLYGCKVKSCNLHANAQCLLSIAMAEY
eukprot:c7811_g1_i1 orf=101-286(+)